MEVDRGLRSAEYTMNTKLYTLLGADRRPYEGPTRGALGGHMRCRLYGRLDCEAALRAIARGGYVKNRVFVADEKIAIAAFNAQTTEQKKNLSLLEVFRHQEDVHHRLIELIEGVPEDQLGGDTRFRHRVRLDTYGHYPKHANAIKTWRERRLSA